MSSVLEGESDSEAEVDAVAQADADVEAEADTMADVDAEIEAEAEADAELEASEGDQEIMDVEEPKKCEKCVNDGERTNVSMHDKHENKLFIDMPAA